MIIINNIQFVHPEKLTQIFQVFHSKPVSVFSILVPLWFIIISFIDGFYLHKLLFSDFVQFKDNSVCSQK